MAMAIASVPVLTGEVAERFETEAQNNYEMYLNRSEEDKKYIAERYERGMEMVRKVLAKSHIGSK